MGETPFVVPRSCVSPSAPRSGGGEEGREGMWMAALGLGVLPKLPEEEWHRGGLIVKGACNYIVVIVSYEYKNIQINLIHYGWAAMNARAQNHIFDLNFVITWDYGRTVKRGNLFFLLICAVHLHLTSWTNLGSIYFLEGLIYRLMGSVLFISSCISLVFSQMLRAWELRQIFEEKKPRHSQYYLCGLENPLNRELQSSRSRHRSLMFSLVKGCGQNAQY